MMRHALDATSRCSGRGAVCIAAATAAVSRVVLLFVDFGTIPQCTSVTYPPAGLDIAAGVLVVAGGGLQLVIAGPRRRRLGWLLAGLIAACCLGFLLTFSLTGPQDACLF